MESHVGCSTSHPGQFCDKIDQDVVLIALYFVDFIYGRIPILKQTSKDKTTQKKKKGKKQTSKQIIKTEVEK